MPGESTTFAQSLDSRAATGLSAMPLFHAAWLFAVGVAATQAVWLRPGYVLVALADMFPQTFHLETIALLRRA